MNLRKKVVLINNTSIQKNNGKTSYEKEMFNSIANY
jgi:hypothetical protein